jgi:hypothetical protein
MAVEHDLGDDCVWLVAFVRKPIGNGEGTLERQFIQFPVKARMR